MTGLRAPGLPEDLIRARARGGAAAAFPPLADYGSTVYGSTASGSPGQGSTGHGSAGSDTNGSGAPAADPLAAMRLVPPVFVPRRLEKLIELGAEPMPADVVLDTLVGGFSAPCPLYLSAFGSTQVASTDLGESLSRQAGRLAIPMVIGENVVPVNGYGRIGARSQRSLLGRIAAYAEGVGTSGQGGVVIQQSTEDADAEVWNLVYSDPLARPLLDSGRLGFELKVGQGAKPGLGGMTVVDRSAGNRLVDRFGISDVFGGDSGSVLRCASPGTFTQEILRQQIHLMRNNFPRCRIWVKLPPARDVAEAADVAWESGADAVTVDGAEGGTGWAPWAFLDQVGLPLGECLQRIGRPGGSLLVSGRIWEGARAVKCLALGATAVGLGRAALLAVDEDPADGLIRLVECLRLELSQLISALGKYAAADVGAEDIWSPGQSAHLVASV
jgi:methylamine---glutamate N-methyltransferase subunit C